MSEATTQPSVTERLTAGYTGRMMLVIALGSMASQVGWLVIPPLLPAIIDDLAISSAQAGFALTLLTLFAAAGRYPGGRLADELSRKTVIGFCLVAWIVGFSILAVATTYPLFLLGVSVAGIGIGMYVPAAFAQLSDLFAAKRGQAFGVNNAAYNLAGILAPGLAFAVLLVGPWRLSFVVVVCVVVVLAALVHVWNEEPYVVERVELGFRATVVRTVFDPQVRRVLVVASLISFVWNGSVSFLPLYLESEHGLTSGTAGIAFASLFLVGALVTPLSGWVGDRFGSLRTILVTVCFAVAGLVTLTTTSSVAGVFVGVVVFAIGLLGFWPVMTAYMMSIFPEDSRGGDYGAIGTVYAGVGSTGPAYVGTVGQHLDYTTAYIGFVGCLLVCLGIVLSVRSS